MKFSKTTGCFYPDDIEYRNLPDDLIDCTQNEYVAAMNRAPGETIDVVGGHVAVIPVPAAQIKAQKWDEIKAERDRRSDNGGYKVGNKWFHSDIKSRTQQLGLVQMGASIPAGLQWKTMDGSFVTMTQSLAGQILAAAAASDQAIFAAAETHKAAMMASDDPSSYNYLSGWPAGFGE